jgi:hypothetical protein
VATSPRRKNPFPAATDTPDVVRDIRALAQALDTAPVDTQGLRVDRPESNLVLGQRYTATDTGIEYRYDGTAWQALNPRPSQGAADTTEALRAIGSDAGQVVAGNDPRLLNASPPLVTALPANPVDGQECYFGTALASGAVWHLRYRAAASSAYKWDVLGGLPVVNTDPNSHTLRQYGINVWGLHDPVITAPLAGEYFVTGDASIATDGGSGVTYLAYSIIGNSGYPAVTDANTALQPAPGGMYHPIHKERTVTAAAGTWIRPIIQVTGTDLNTTLYVTGMALTAIPIRVGLVP